jgi:hypothetical protein
MHKISLYGHIFMWFYMHVSCVHVYMCAVLVQHVLFWLVCCDWSSRFEGCTPDGCPFAPCTGLNAEVMNSSKAWSQTERCACAWVPCHRHKIGSWKTGCWMILKLRGKSDPNRSNPDSESVSAKSKCFKSEGCPSKDSIDWGSHYSGQVDRSSG